VVAAGHYAVQRFGPKVDSEPLLAVGQKNQTKKFVQDALIKAKSPKNKNQKRMKNGCAKGRCWMALHCTGPEKAKTKQTYKDSTTTTRLHTFSFSLGSLPV